VSVKNLRVIVAAFAGFLGTALPAMADRSAPPKLTFGVVPQQSATKLAEVWTPLLAYLSSKTGYNIEFRTGQDIRAFERRVETGEFDFAYYSPLHYANFRSSGYQAVAREKDTRLVGIVVVSKESKYKGLKDLHGITMAFPSPTAFAATVLPQLSLQQLGVNVVPKYVSSHESVYRAVAHGLYPAGGGIVKTYEQVDPAVRSQLRILWKSPSYTSHPVAVHQRVSKKVTQRVVAALLAMAQDPEGALLLKAAGYKGFITAQDSDYKDIRRLHVSIGQPGVVPKEK